MSNTPKLFQGGHRPLNTLPQWESKHPLPYHTTISSSVTCCCPLYQYQLMWQVSYVSRWRGSPVSSSSLSPGVTGACSSGYYSNCSSDLHDSKTRTCSSDDVTPPPVMTSLSQPAASVKHELDLSLLQVDISHCLLTSSLTTHSLTTDPLVQCVHANLPMIDS